MVKKKSSLAGNPSGGKVVEMVVKNLLDFFQNLDRNYD